MEQWKTLSRQTILDAGKFLVVENHTIELPDGQVLDNWSWLITPDYVNVAVVTESGQFLCFKQTKYGVEGTTLAPVGGYVEPGEDPLAAAQREMLEETGYKAPHWTGLGQYVTDGNRGSGMAHLFLARDAYSVAEPDADDLEEQEMIFLSRTEVEIELAAGNFKVLAWPTVMALALLHLQN